MTFERFSRPAYMCEEIIARLAAENDGSVETRSRQSDMSERAIECSPLSILRLARKVAVALAGGSVLAAGIALIVLPGPAVLVIPLGLTILATEFPWARRLLHRATHVAAPLLYRLRTGRRSEEKVPLILAVACATSTPIELKNARVAYARASSGPAVDHTPADLHKAKSALDQAEKSQAEDRDKQETIDLAYIAERTAQIAEARAVTAIAEKSTDKSKAEYGAKQSEMIKTAQGALAKTKDQLAESERGQLAQAQLTDAERAARVESDKKAALSEQNAALSDQKAKEANEALAKLAAKEEERGLVITLSGSVLFRSNDAELLPAALSRLDQVAEALVVKGREVTVEGHTDSQGTASNNMNLSQRRAESVRSYLVTRGFPTEKILARGLGPDRPIAQNSNAEGRANNRRVEIIIAKIPAKVN
jgi:outer membrane protein OmpA-like peptidoglycan-associated protein